MRQCSVVFLIENNTTHPTTCDQVKWHESLDMTHFFGILEGKGDWGFIKFILKLDINAAHTGKNDKIFRFCVKDLSFFAENKD